MKAGWGDIFLLSVLAQMRCPGRGAKAHKSTETPYVAMRAGHNDLCQMAAGALGFLPRLRRRSWTAGALLRRVQAWIVRPQTLYSLLRRCSRSTGRPAVLAGWPAAPADAESADRQGSETASRKARRIVDSFDLHRFRPIQADRRPLRACRRRSVAQERCRAEAVPCKDACRARVQRHRS